ncbi:MAG: DUF547 domain-containing protein [Elainellaceae cyanobacterium]
MAGIVRIRPLINLKPSIALLIVAGILGTGGSIAGCSNAPLEQSLSESEAVSSEQVATEPFSYEPYAEVLQVYVDEGGQVDYEALQQNRQQLDQFNASIGAVSAATYESWSDEQKIAFLINAYNSFTLQSIIDQDPIKPSIRDIPGVWRIRTFDIAGQSKTLDNIEHQTLRTEFNEPRIHAALNCTALSCPPLRQEPYTAEQLDQQLDQQVEQWLSSPYGVQIDRDAGEVKISEIFDWFGEDWLTDYGVEAGFTGSDKERAALNFMTQYLDDDDAAYLEAGDYQVKYLDYDWSLNQQ